MPAHLREIDEMISRDIRAISAESSATNPTHVNGKIPTNDGWYSRLILNQDGKAKPVLSNAISALRNAPEWDGVLGFNDFSSG